MNRSSSLIVSIVMILVMTTLAVGCTSTSDIESKTTDLISEESGAATPVSEDSDTSFSDTNAYVVNLSANSDNTLNVTLNGEELTSDDAVKEDDGDLKLKAAGTYELSGTIGDGRIVVDAGEDAVVRLILNGLNVSNDDDSAIFIKTGGLVSLVLAQGSQNSLSQAGCKESESRDGAIYSKTALTITGEGALTVAGNYSHGIVAKDDLVLEGGIIEINSVKDAIHCDGSISIGGGDLTLTAGDDAVHADGDLNMTAGEILIKACYEGLEGTNVNISGGNIDITCTDDGINATGETSSGQEDPRQGGFGKGGFGQGGFGQGGFDSSERPERPEMPEGFDSSERPEMPEMPEGFDSSERPEMPEGFDSSERPEMPEGFPRGKRDSTQGFGEKAKMSDTDAVITSDTIKNNTENRSESTSDTLTKSMPESSSDSSTDTLSNIVISGGKIRIVNSTGRDADGLDSNGNIAISGGEVFISLSGNGGNCALDYGSEAGGSCVISGGTVIAAGSSTMQEKVSGSGETGIISVKTNGVTSDNAVVEVLDDDGRALLSAEIPVGFNNIIISSPVLRAGTDYKVTIDGTEYK